MGTQQFCLRWNNHQTNLVSVFDNLLQDGELVDVTLACGGRSVKAHKMVLSACSPFFRSLFAENPCQHPIVILKDIEFDELQAILGFMYKGEVNVTQDNLTNFLRTAETLKVKGLAEVSNDTPDNNKPPPSTTFVNETNVSQQIITNTAQPAPVNDSNGFTNTSSIAKRKRLRRRSNSRSGGSDSEDMSEIRPSASTTEKKPSTTVITNNDPPVESQPMEQVASRNENEDAVQLNETNSALVIDLANTNPSSENTENHELWNPSEVSDRGRMASTGSQVPISYGSSALPSTFNSNTAAASAAGGGGDTLPPFSVLHTMSMVSWGSPPSSQKPISTSSLLPSSSSVQKQTSKHLSLGTDLLNSDFLTNSESQKQVTLIPPYDLKIFPGQLECVLRMSRGSPTHLLRSLMDIYFASDLLANSSFLTLDKKIMDALKAYVMSLYPTVKESQLNVAATDKCVQTKRRILGTNGTRKYTSIEQAPS